MIGQSPAVPEPAGAPEDGTRPPADRDAGKSRPREFGGRDGPEPTRYGDWEKNGRSVDF